MRMFLSIFAKGVMIWENENFYIYKVLKSKSFRWRLGRVNCRGKFQKWLLIRDPWPLKITWLLCTLCHRLKQNSPVFSLLHYLNHTWINHIHVHVSLRKMMKKNNKMHLHNSFSMNQYLHKKIYSKLIFRKKKFCIHIDSDTYVG